MIDDMFAFSMYQRIMMLFLAFISIIGIADNTIISDLCDIIALYAADCCHNNVYCSIVGTQYNAIVI